jgi:hypothetical protein
MPLEALCVITPCSFAWVELLGFIFGVGKGVLDGDT